MTTSRRACRIYPIQVNTKEGFLKQREAVTSRFAKLMAMEDEEAGQQDRAEVNNGTVVERD